MCGLKQPYESVGFQSLRAYLLANYSVESDPSITDRRGIPPAAYLIEQEIIMQKSLLAALVAAALIVPFAAQAEGTYVTLGVGQSDYSNLGPGVPAQRPTGFNLGVGFAIDKT